MTATAITPITLLTGFLGSGKTTLLNRLLRDPAAADSAVIVNEFGAVAIDHALVREASENVVLLAGGCVCCQVAGDLVQALRELYFKRAAGEIPPFRRAIVETTGLADPAPLLRTIIELPLVAARYALAGVATTVDGVHGMDELDRHPEAVKQAAIADRIVVTKADLAPPSRLAQLEARLAELNPGAGRVRAAGGAVDANWLLETGLTRGAARRPDAASWLNAGAYRPAGASLAPLHDPRIRAFAWWGGTADSHEEVEDGLETLLALAGERILRLKGLIAIAGEAGPVALHAVQHTLYPAARLAAWPDADRRSRIVVIARDLEDAFVAQILDSFVRAPAREPGAGQAAAAPTPR
jgi:G3E family GTPase